MKQKSILFLFTLLLSLSGCGKKETILITNENKREVLEKYGKENTEKKVVIKTDFGVIKIRLYDEAPLHRANFIKLIKDGYYNDRAEFYRVVEKFVVQGGVPMKKLDYTIPAEINPKYYHKKGAVAMARLDENNPEKESSSTEFYIVHGNKYADWEYAEEEKELGLHLLPEQKQIYTTLGGEMSLDSQYTVFGEVTEGLDVVDRIAVVRTYSEKPYQKVSFEIKVEN
ncbi:MAG: Peptidyl-prolyl cis-trans isomerase [Cytophagales bacterium]|jgi:cyclophilin family peptidyl-prolyl cis-trans isomerase|nr:peptidylprolyl isomerase [Bacteroidota bacterium]WHZ07384.1 MAG: Peptidyl-prolyl cis-trans isomerase [Cytophagales bacterium]